MDWVTIIQTTLATTSSIAVILVILGYIAYRLFSQILSRDIENYKIKLQTEVDLLKANLEKTSIEHQIRFERLHAERAKIIAELYRLLAQTEKDTIELIMSLNSDHLPFFAGSDEKARASREELSDYFSKNRIYFTSTLCEQISHFIEDLSQIDWI
ncbi:MAG: hypothetical protein IPJ90_06760 [Anaerolineaceae bacterium]|nr:hypothetical protein [Anaerolineaceae bacterium]